MAQLDLAGVLEAGDLATLRIDGAEDVANGAVLAGGVAPLEHDEQGVSAVGVEHALEVRDAGGLASVSRASASPDGASRGGRAPARQVELRMGGDGPSGMPWSIPENRGPVTIGRGASPRWNDGEAPSPQNGPAVYTCASSSTTSCGSTFRKVTGREGQSGPTSKPGTLRQAWMEKCRCG